VSTPGPRPALRVRVRSHHVRLAGPGSQAVTAALVPGRTVTAAMEDSTQVTKPVGGGPGPGETRSAGPAAAAAGPLRT
jgi:hypothetical protein